MEFLSATGFAFPPLPKQELTRGDIRTVEIISKKVVGNQLENPINTSNLDMEMKLNGPISFLTHYSRLKEANTVSNALSLTFLNSSESDDSSKKVEESDSDIESDEISIAPQELHYMNKLHLDHQFLSEQNRVLIKELAYAKMTAQALRSIILQKDEQLSQLAKGLPNVNLATLNSIKLPTLTNENGTQLENGTVGNDNKLNDVVTATTTGKRKDELSLSSKMKLTFKLRGLSSKP